jgi:hypothetical protein
MRKDIGGTRRLISGDKIYVLDIEELTISEIELKKEHFCKEFADNTHVYDSSKHCFMTVNGKEYFLDSGVHRFRNLNGDVEVGTLSHTSNRYNEYFIYFTKSKRFRAFISRNTAKQHLEKLKLNTRVSEYLPNIDSVTIYDAISGRKLYQTFNVYSTTIFKALSTKIKNLEAEGPVKVDVAMTDGSTKSFDEIKLHLENL